MDEAMKYRDYSTLVSFPTWTSQNLLRELLFIAYNMFWPIQFVRQIF